MLCPGDVEPNSAMEVAAPSVHHLIDVLLTLPQEFMWFINTYLLILHLTAALVPSTSVWLQEEGAAYANKLVPQGRDQVAKLPLFVRTQTHILGKSQ